MIKKYHTKKEQLLFIYSDFSLIALLFSWEILNVFIFSGLNKDTNIHN